MSTNHPPAYRPSPPQQPPLPPRESWPRRHKILTALGSAFGLLIAIIFSVAGGGMSASASASAASAPVAAATSAPPKGIRSVADAHAAAFHGVISLRGQLWGGPMATRRTTREPVVPHGGGRAGTGSGISGPSGDKATHGAQPSIASGRPVSGTIAQASAWASSSLPSGLGFLADITCPPGQTAMCVGVGQDTAGAAGIILTSSNGGANWTQQPVPAGVNALYGASCADVSHCWAVGQLGPSSNYDGVMLATTDGGHSWAVQSLPATPFGSYPWIRRISCVKVTGYDCWAVAPYYEGVLATTDGGTTWQIQGFSEKGGLEVFPEDIDFVTGSVGYLVGGDRCGGQVTECPGFIYKTTDGGATWMEVFDGFPYMDGISCTDISHCWAAASTFTTGVVLASSDGGSTWPGESLPSFSGELNAIACSPYQGNVRCWIAGDNGTATNLNATQAVLLTTTSSGSCWAPDNLPNPSGPLYGAAASGLSNGWVVGTITTSATAGAWYTTTASAPPVVTGVSPTGGPFTGKTPVTISGCGFTQTSQVHFGKTPAASVVYVSSHKLTATTSPISLYNVGPQQVTVSSGGATSNPDARSQFTYYAPEIGRLVFHSSEYSECTASVVNSADKSVVLTAGHCVGSSGAFYIDFAFAPGYYGPVCTGKLASSAAYLKCGTAPYGIWSARKVGSNNQWLNNTDHALDYGFLVMNTLNGKTLQQAINGGLAITFNPGRGQSWTTFAEPGAVLLHCSGSASNYNGGSPGPDMMTFRAPTCAIGGASGGPWVNGANGAFYGIGAVNSEASSGSIYGAYLGTEAQNTFLGIENS